MNEKQRGRKRPGVKAAVLLPAICLLGACALFLLARAAGFGGMGGQGARLSFEADSPGGTGFRRDAAIYTGDGVTEVRFSGSITADKTAEIIVTADSGGEVVFRASYSQPQREAVRFTLEDLEPWAHYTVSFVSGDSSAGRLLLTSDEALAERPRRPEHTAPSRPAP